jgi:hypothetical protein
MIRIHNDLGPLASFVRQIKKCLIQPTGTLVEYPHATMTCVVSRHLWRPMNGITPIKKHPALPVDDSRTRRDIPWVAFDRALGLAALNHPAVQ